MIVEDYFSVDIKKPRALGSIAKSELWKVKRMGEGGGSKVRRKKDNSGTEPVKRHKAFPLHMAREEGVEAMK